MFSKQFFYSCILPLFLGGIIYIGFRDTTIVLMKILFLLKLKTFILLFREYLKQAFIIPEWFIFSLPDGLYLFSLTNFILYKFNNIKISLLVFFIMILSEILPLMIKSVKFYKFSIDIGTFD